MLGTFDFYATISVRSNSLNLKYQRFTPPGCKDIGIKTFELVAKTQFFSDNCFQNHNANILNLGRNSYL